LNKKRCKEHGTYLDDDGICDIYLNVPGSSSVHNQVMQRNEMLWNWKNYISLNDNMSLEHIYQMLKDLDDRLQIIESA
jgi:hypothetical protein